MSFKAEFSKGLSGESYFRMSLGCVRLWQRVWRFQRNRYGTCCYICSVGSNVMISALRKVTPEKSGYLFCSSDCYVCNNSRPNHGGVPTGSS